MKPLACALHNKAKSFLKYHFHFLSISAEWPSGLRQQFHVRDWRWFEPGLCQNLLLWTNKDYVPSDHYGIGVFSNVYLLALACNRSRVVQEVNIAGALLL